MILIEILLILLIINILYFGIIWVVFYAFYKYPHAFQGLKKYILHLNNMKYEGSDGIIYQNTLLGCGAHSFEMVLKSFNVKYRRDDLDSLFKMRGTSMMDLHNKFAEYRLRPQGVYMQESGELTRYIKKGTLAAIISFDFRYLIPSDIIFFVPLNRIIKILLGNGYKTIRHWVVAEYIDEEGQVHILDPYMGKFTIKLQKLNELWNNKVLLVSNNCL
jgi:ABC-type bacteriocin/lantibiotic exporter with double-glycine peptidase domain